MVLDIYSEQLGQSAEIDTLVERLRERVLDSVEVSQLAGSTQGMLEMLMAGEIGRASCRERVCAIV